MWYLPFAQQSFPLPVSLPLDLVVRARGEPTGVATAVREAIRTVDRDQPVAGVTPMTKVLSEVLVVERFSAVLMATLATLGLGLSAMGLYGVIAYSVGQRTGELGLRMALGARPSDVLRLVLGQALSLVALGLGLGAAGALGVARLLSSALYEVSPNDPATLGLVALVLGGVSLLACWLPARRATRVSPMAALRSE